MVKVFTTNSCGKIEFTKEELDNLLNEVWDDGYREGSRTSYIPYYPITTPNYPIVYKVTPYRDDSPDYITTAGKLYD